MAYPVKIYDGDGNYLRTIEPEFNYANNGVKRRFQAHECPSCQYKTTNKKYCSACLIKRKEKASV